MTPPIDPTDPTGTGPLDGTEARLRAALGGRAAQVAPRGGDPAELDAAVAADAQRRRRRAGLAAGAAAAAAIVVGALVVLPGGDDDADQVQTADESTTTEAPPPSTTEVPTSTTTTTEPAPTTTEAPSTTVTAPPTTAPPSTTTTTVAPLPGAGDGPVSGPRVGNVMAAMTDIRVARNDGYDRVVLEFRDGVLPEWGVQYVDPPIRSDGSGEVVPVAGSAFLQVRMDGAAGYDEATYEPVYPGPDRFGGGDARHVVEVVETNEFEAIYVWTVGLDQRRPFRVQTLADPARIVLDIAHAS